MVTEPTVSGAVYNSNTLTAPYIFQTHPALKGLKTLLDLHTSGIGWNGSFGILARPFRRLEIGVAYRTSTSIVSTGEATGNMGAQFSSLGIPFNPEFGYKAQVRVKAAAVCIDQYSLASQSEVAIQPTGRLDQLEQLVSRPPGESVRRHKRRYQQLSKDQFYKRRSPAELERPA